MSKKDNLGKKISKSLSLYSTQNTERKEDAFIFYIVSSIELNQDDTKQAKNTQKMQILLIFVPFHKFLSM